MTTVCIIGAGMAGSVLACELLRHKNCELVLIDTDSIKDSFNHDRSLAMSFQGGSFIENFKTVGYGFGGTSNLWHGVITRLDDEDFDYLGSVQRKYFIAELREAELELSRYFGNLNSLDDLPQSFEGHPLNKYVDLSKLEPKKYIVKFFPTRFRERLRTVINSGNPKLRLIQDSVATRLIYNKGRISGVECSSKSSRFIVQADKYVICTGALESPRLILQSLEGSSVNNSLIGCGLMDHPYVTLGELRLPRMVLYGHHGRSSFLIPNSQRIGFRIPIMQRRTREMNHSLFFRPHFNQNNQVARENIRSLIYGGWRSAKWGNLFSGSMLRSAMSLGLEKAGIGYATSHFLVSAQLEQLIDTGGKVTLTNDLDVYGRRIPLIQNSISEDLLAEAKYLSELVAGFTYPQSSYSSSNLESSEFKPGAHHSGTCRLGLDPNTSVVDLNLQYHGIDNLYVCDSSVLPKIGNANLSLTLASLAIRLARNFSNEMNSC